MNIKLFGLILTVLFAFAGYVIANDDFLEAAKSSYLQVKPFYQKMSTCTPYYTKDIYDRVYKVIGTNGNNCDVILEDQSCSFPIDKSKEYALKSLEYTNKKIAEIDRNQSFSFSTSDPEIQYSMMMQNKYCKLNVIYY